MVLVELVLEVHGCFAAEREGLDSGPWEHLKEQVVLGIGEFLEKLRKFVVGNARGQRGAVRLAVARPNAVRGEGGRGKINGESWPECRDRHGDSGRDLVLYLSRRMCGLKLQDLAKTSAMTDYSAVSIAVRRLEKWRRRNATERDQFQRLCQLLNVET